GGVLPLLRSGRGHPLRDRRGGGLGGVGGGGRGTDPSGLREAVAGTGGGDRRSGVPAEPHGRQGGGDLGAGPERGGGLLETAGGDGAGLPGTAGGGSGRRRHLAADGRPGA